MLIVQNNWFLWLHFLMILLVHGWLSCLLLETCMPARLAMSDIRWGSVLKLTYLEVKSQAASWGQGEG